MDNQAQDTNTQSIEDVILQWQNEFERTTGIESIVRIMKHEPYTHLVHYFNCDNEPIFSSYNKDMFLSAIATLKERPSLILA